MSQQMEQLTAQKAEIQKQLEQTKAENERLKSQSETLSRLGDKRAEAIYHLKEVKIGRFTNLYDENKDGVKESLVVYVQPIDEVSDVVKAAGAVEVQLWDLNSPDTSKALLDQWKVEPAELKKAWMESLMSSGYRFVFDAAEIVAVPATAKQLTVKITFTDYLSGTTFIDQKAIKQ